MSNTTTNRKAKSSTSKAKAKATKAKAKTTAKATKAKTKAKAKAKTTTKAKAKTTKAKLSGGKPLIATVASETEVVEVPRLEATRESITQHFDKLLADLDAEVKNLRATKCPGAKFLKNVSKTVKGLKTKSLRVMGKKPKKRTNVNSGFLKQVAISKEMAKFIGCGADDLKSRVDVTKAICAYIKDHSLQNPKDKREILPDSKLKKLLRIDKGDEPLTYYRVQSKLKPHFP